MRRTGSRAPACDVCRSDQRLLRWVALLRRRHDGGRGVIGIRSLRHGCDGYDDSIAVGLRRDAGRAGDALAAREGLLAELAGTALAVAGLAVAKARFRVADGPVGAHCEAPARCAVRGG